MCGFKGWRITGIFIVFFLVSSGLCRGQLAGECSLPDVVIKPSPGSLRFGMTLDCGDVNGDGMDDILVGQPNYDDTYAPVDGNAYVIYGSDHFEPVFDLSVETQGWTFIIGEEERDLGSSLAMGDIDGDGLADLCIGANYSTIGGLYERGIVFILFGKASGLGKQRYLFEGASDGMVLGRDEGDHLGSSIAIGDINGDGRRDLILGAPSRKREDGSYDLTGGVFVLFQPESGFPHEWDLSVNSEDVAQIWGKKNNDRCGFSLACSDMNEDGFDDILIGAYKADHGIRDEGEAYLVYGSSDFPVLFDLRERSDFDCFLGKDFPEHMAYSMALGDVNNDSYQDVIMGARQASHSYLDLSGRVRIQFGNGQRFGVVDYQQQDPDVIIEGSRAYEQMGRRIALGDFDGDMIMDFAAGAPMPLIYPGDASGRVQVILGGDDLPFHLDLSYETADAMLEGNSGGDCFGEGLAAGDVNGDGVCDLVVGAPRADTTGIVYIFYGDEQMEVEGWEDVVPGSLTLEQNFPNPFNSETVISFSLPDRNSNIGGKSELLEIIDVTGRVMALWDLSGYPPGRHQITWNGTSMSGKSCSSGIYISRLRFGNLNKEIKLIFTR